MDEETYIYALFGLYITKVDIPKIFSYIIQILNTKDIGYDVISKYGDSIFVRVNGHDRFVFRNVRRRYENNPEGQSELNRRFDIVVCNVLVTVTNIDADKPALGLII